MFPDLSFNLGFFKFTPFLGSLILATILSSFSIWRRLREDYPEEMIFSLTLLSLGGSLFSSRLLTVILNWSEFDFSLANFFAFGLKNGLSLEGALIGLFLTASLYIAHQKRNYWEILDAFCLPIFYFLFLGGIGLFLTVQDFWFLGYSALGLGGLVSFPFLQKRYRSFVWYPSGKTGFLVSFYSLLLFVSLLVLAFLKNGRLYLNEAILAGLSLVSGGALYYRSEREIKKDLENIFKFNFLKRKKARI